VGQKGEEPTAPKVKELTSQEKERVAELEEIRMRAVEYYGKLGIRPEEIEVADHTGSTYRIEFFGAISIQYPYRAHSYAYSENHKWDNYTTNAVRVPGGYGGFHYFRFKRVQRKHEFVVIKCFKSYGNEGGMFAKDFTTGRLIRGKEVFALWEDGSQEIQIPKNPEPRQEWGEYDVGYISALPPRLKLKQDLKPVAQSEKKITQPLKKRGSTKRQKRELVEQQLVKDYIDRE